MSDTSKSEPKPVSKDSVEIPRIASLTHPPIVHVSTPFDGPKGKPETESDEGEQGTKNA
jgi:hypothetical protein